MVVVRRVRETLMKDSSSSPSFSQGTSSLLTLLLALAPTRAGGGSRGRWMRGSRGWRRRGRRGERRRGRREERRRCMPRPAPSS